MRILVVDSNRRSCCALKGDFIVAGHEVEVAYNGESALREAFTHSFDALITEMNMPDIDGVEVISRLRSVQNEIPAIILSSKYKYEDRVRGLEAGADDYMMKPYGVGELLLRLKNITLRHQKRLLQEIQLDDISIDLHAQEVFRGGSGIRLRPLEFKLLTALALVRGRVISRTQLLKNVWGYDFEPSTNLVRVAVARLREQIDNGREKPLIETIYGVGYRILLRAQTDDCFCT
jgi:two-component system OmpR family response regulator